MTFSGIGEAGQRKLLESKAAILGLGALGTVVAGSLARSGVGFLRLIDRDYVELSNLERQTLFTEEDARKETPKAIAAAEHLSEVNSHISLEPVVTDLNSGNVEALIAGADLLLDGSDNFEVRFLLNEACHKARLPWVYGGALGSTGAVMNILPGGPCFRCFIPEMPPAGTYPTCSTRGILNQCTGIIGAYEAVEALKILTGSPAVSRQYLSLDIWNNSADYMTLEPNPDCPVCARGDYELLGKPPLSSSLSLCGRNAVQIIPGRKTAIDFETLARGLEKAGQVKWNPYMLSFEGPRGSFNLFPDGRAVIKNTADEGAARSLYAEYIGL
jgi:adenylyltransferase/sulfurtransferase